MVASAFRTTRHSLRDHAVFRGKLRQLPRTKSQQNIEANLSTDRIRFAADAPSVLSANCPTLSTSPRPLKPRPLLSVLCVRWFDYWSDPDRCSDYSTLNDGYFTDLFDGPCSMGKLLPGEFEVFTVFIRCTADLTKLQPQQLRSMLGGRNVVAWYFVWPSTCSAEGAGYVSEQDFFSVCRSMEAASIRTGWPHESSLYRQLCGKLWVAEMSLNKDYWVPPTTRVQLSEFKADGRQAATRALETLMQLRSSVWGKEPVPFEDFKGVAKLGFSWCGSDVLPFRGLNSLVSNLGKLFGSSDVESTVCMVQEMVPGVIGEHRIICMYDKAAGTVRREALWMENMSPGTAPHKYKLQSLDVAEFKVAGSHCVPDGSVASRVFRGDVAAQRDAEAKGAVLAERWMQWFKTQAPEPPQCTRLDFLVGHRGAGEADVWTCEVGECGASLCSVEVHGRNLAALNHAISHDPSGRFPMLLPKTIPRNNGSKS